MTGPKPMTVLTTAELDAADAEYEMVFGDIDQDTKTLRRAEWAYNWACRLIASHRAQAADLSAALVRVRELEGLAQAARDWVEIDELPSPPATAEMLKSSDRVLFVAVRQFVALSTTRPQSTEAPVEDDEPCPLCGGGDPVPATGYRRCPFCDAEWNADDDARGVLALANGEPRQ